MNLFEKASRIGLRFVTSRGNITVEDVWDLPLTSNIPNFSLDDLAKDLNKALKEGETESFVEKKVSVNEGTKLAFDIVKHIIDVRLEEAKQAESDLAAREKKRQILAIIADKESEDLKGASLDDLKKMLEEL